MNDDGSHAEASLASSRLLIPCAFLHSHGGLENYVEALARAALLDGFEVRVVSPFHLSETSTLRSRLGADVIFSSAQEEWWKTPRGRWRKRLAQVRRRLLRQKEGEPSGYARSAFKPALPGYWAGAGRDHLEWASVVHTVGRPNRFVQSAIEQAATASKPIVFSEVAEVTRQGAERSDQCGFADVCGSCDVIVGYYQAQLEAIRDHYGYRGSTEIIDQWAYGLERDLLALPVAGSEGDVSQWTLTVGSVSRLSAEKRIEDLLCALREVMGSEESSAPPIRLRIAGAGKEERKLRALAADLRLGSHIEWLGYVPDLAGFYASIDCLVVASSSEGGPITAVEGMAAGRAIVTTPVGGNPERLQGGVGEFFEVGDVSGLASLLRDLSMDRQRVMRLGAAARERYLERNSGTVLDARLVALWRALEAPKVDGGHHV